MLWLYDTKKKSCIIKYNSLDFSRGGPIGFRDIIANYFVFSVRSGNCPTGYTAQWLLLQTLLD